MTEDKFYEQCRVQFENIWKTHGVYEAMKFEPSWLKLVANDLKIIAKNIEDLCAVYETENKGVNNGNAKN